MTIEILKQKIKECKDRLESLDKSYYIGTPKGDKTQEEVSILKKDLEKLLDYATELNAGSKEISEIATLIVLCRMV